MSLVSLVSGVWCLASWTLIWSKCIKTAPFGAGLSVVYTDFLPDLQEYLKPGLQASVRENQWCVQATCCANLSSFDGCRSIDIGNREEFIVPDRSERCRRSLKLKHGPWVAMIGMSVSALVGFMD